MIVSNPPYIRTKYIRHLNKDVKDFEPLMALDGGESGTEVISKVIFKAKKLLKTKGLLFLEIGEGQEHQVEDLLAINNFGQTYKNNLPLKERIHGFVNVVAKGLFNDKGMGAIKKYYEHNRK